MSEPREGPSRSKVLEEVESLGVQRSTISDAMGTAAGCYSFLVYLFAMLFFVPAVALLLRGAFVFAAINAAIGILVIYVGRKSPKAAKPTFDAIKDKLK